MSKLLIIDLSGVFHPVWHATSHKSVGEAYQIVLGKVRGLIQAEEFTRVAVAVDSTARNFRKDICADYKANRDAPDQLLLGQLREVIDQLRRDGAHVFEAEGFEADDVIATLVEWAREEGAFSDVVVFSDDKDMAQLVHDAQGDQEVSVMLWRSKEAQYFRAADVKTKWGVRPSQFADWLALTGDASDNIPGVKGVGPKKAAALLKEFGDLAGITDGLIHRGTKFTPALASNLRESIVPPGKGVVAGLSAKLVALRTDAIAPAECAKLLHDPADAAHEEAPEHFGDGEQYDGGPGPESQRVPRFSGEVADPAAADTEPPPDEPPWEWIGIAKHLAKATGRKYREAYSALMKFNGDADAALAFLTNDSASPQVIDAELEEIASRDSEPAHSTTALAVRDVPFNRSLEPMSAAEAFNMSKHIFHSRLFSAYGNQQAVFTTILMGRSLGLDAMTALRGVHVIKGKPVLSAQLIHGLVLNSGKAEYFQLLESTSEKATYATRRKGDPHPVTMSFTIGDAERAGLLKPSRSGEPTQWDKIPRTMLRWRCVAELARAVYPDVVANVYTPDELDVQMALAE